MGIIILEDSSVLSGENRNALLHLELSRRGHVVDTFNGRRGPERERIEDPEAAADLVYQKILEIPAFGVVLDLQWFNQMDYGVRMWERLRGFGLPQRFKAVVWSQLVGAGNRHEYATRLQIPADYVLSRNNTTIDEVADEFDEFIAQ